MVTLDRGGELAELDAVVLAQGHVPVEPTARQREFGRYARRNGLLYFPPANPADVDFAAIGAGQPTGLVGMGLTFFDVVALLTGGRGGVFERDGGGALVYRPSGLEPVLYAGSRRGVPYHARGENEKGVSGRHEPLFLTPSVIEELRERHRSTGTLSFNEHVWPLVSREVRAVYYRALLTERGEAAAGAVFCAEFVARGGPEGAEEAALLDRHGIPAERRWSWPLIERPYGEREFADRWVFQGWLLGHLREDVAEALKGNVSSPLKAALDVLRDLRNEIRLVVDHAGISGRSYRDELRAWYTPLNAYLSIGPASPPDRGADRPDRGRRRPDVPARGAGRTGAGAGRVRPPVGRGARLRRTGLGADRGAAQRARPPLHHRSAAALAAALGPVRAVPHPGRRRMGSTRPAGWPSRAGRTTCWTRPAARIRAGSPSGCPPSPCTG